MTWEIYYFICLCWGIFCGWKQHNYPLHNSFSWVLTVFTVNFLLMPIGVLVFLYRVFVKGEDV